MNILNKNGDWVWNHGLDPWSEFVCAVFQEDEVEASLRIVNKMLGEPEASADSNAHKSTAEKSTHEKSALSIDLRNLNPDNEMKKIFGSKVVQNEQK